MDVFMLASEWFIDWIAFPLCVAVFVYFGVYHFVRMSR